MLSRDSSPLALKGATQSYAKGPRCIYQAAPVAFLSAVEMMMRVSPHLAHFQPVAQVPERKLAAELFGNSRRPHLRPHLHTQRFSSADLA